MKPPVLRVRKDAPYYDDAVPPGHARADEEEDEPPRRRRGKLGRLVFLPLVVLALGVAAVLSLRPVPGTARFPGWDVRLQAVIYGDQLLVAFTFSARGTSAAARTAAIHVVLPDTGAMADLSGMLAPPATTIRGQLPMSSGVRKVRAEITVGPDRRVLTLGPGSG